MKHGVRLTIWLVAWLLADASLAAPALRIAVVAEPTPASDVFVAAVTEMPGVGTLVDAGSAQLLLALGDQSLADACAMSLPVIGVQVGPSAVAHWRSQGCRVAAIWRHPEPVAQLRLLHAVLPRVHRVGFLVSEDTRPLLPVLRAEAKALGLELVVGAADDVSALPVRLAEVLSRSDALLALPDPRIYGADQARLILMATYRQGKPLLGPDDHWVRAGALASAYISAEDVLAEVAGMLAVFKHSQTLAADRYPAVSVESNPHVARTFSILLPAPDVLDDAVTETRP